MSKLDFFFSLFKNKAKLPPAPLPLIKITNKELSIDDCKKIIAKCKANNINTQEQALEQGIDLQDIAQRCLAGVQKKLDNEAAEKVAPYTNIPKYSGRSFR